MMAVYFIQAGTDGPIKIGLARNPWRRIHNIQVNNHAALKIVALVSGNRKTEEQLQARFHHAKIRGEWFRPTPDLIEFIESRPIPRKRRRNSYGLLSTCLSMSVKRNRVPAPQPQEPDHGTP